MGRDGRGGASRQAVLEGAAGVEPPWPCTLGSAVPQAVPEVAALR